MIGIGVVPGVYFRRLPAREWKEVSARIFERDGHRCVYCGSGEHLECDHVIPLARGGTNFDDNLTTACKSCNRSKGARTPKQWRGARDG